MKGYISSIFMSGRSENTYLTIVPFPKMTDLSGITLHAIFKENNIFKVYVKRTQVRGGGRGGEGGNNISKI